MQIRLRVYDDLGAVVGTFPVGSWEPHGPDGISFGPGGIITQAVDIPYAGRFNFVIEALLPPAPAEPLEGFPDPEIPS